MDSIVTLFKDTPIPTILVVSGIVFLFLALAGKIAGNLEMPPSRQKWSALASALLLSTGLLLYILPARPQGVQEANNASLQLAAATQSVSMVQPLSTQRGGEALQLADGAPNPVQEEGQGCLDSFFSGLPADRVERVEVGASDQRFSTRQLKNDPAGLLLVDLGQPVVAITYITFEDDKLIKIAAVVDAACQPVDFANATRGGDRNLLLNWDSLEVTTGTDVYSMRFGYFDGMVELDTGKLQD